MKKLFFSTQLVRVISFTLSFLGALNSYIFAQKQIILREMESGKPVQYANIYIGDVVFYSDKDGKIELPDTISSFKISHVCYADTIVRVPTSKHDVVFISPKTYEIPEIIVGNKTSSKLQQVGPFCKKEHLYNGGRSGLLIGVFIPYQKNFDNQYIQGIVADLYNKKALIHGVYEKIENATLRFDLRLPNPQTGTPSSKSLIGGGIVYESNSDGRKSIPLEYPIAFPSSGVFVILEWIVEGQCMNNVMYNPHVRISKSDEQPVTWFKREYKQEDWVNWDTDDGMRQLQTSVYAKALNANIGILITK